MKYVYELTHSYEIEEDGHIYDIFTDIAVYSTKKKALEAVERLKKLPKFKGNPEGFEICKCILNKSYWDEGFVTYK